MRADDNARGKSESALLFLQLCLDGYDLTVLSYVAPVIVAEWGLHDIRSLGLVFSASLVGMLVGSISGGMAADRYGAKATLVASTLAVGLFTLATAGVQTLNQLLVLRALTGLGLGAALPSVVRLVLSGPQTFGGARRLVLTNLGVNVGAAVPGLLIAALLPSIGWQGAFLVGGVLALVLVIALLRWLPSDQTTRAISSMDRSSLAALFAGPLALSTPLLWAIFALNGAMLYLIISWAPTLATRAGMSVGAAGLASTGLQLGGIIAGLIMGKALDRYGPAFLASVLGASCVLIGAMGFTLGHDIAYSANLFLLGGALFASLFSLNFFSGRLYPPEVRGAGAGFGSAFGRVGSFIGPIAGSSLAASPTKATLYLAAALPMLVATGCAAVMALAVTRNHHR